MYSPYGDNRNYGNVGYYINYQGANDYYYDSYNPPHTQQNIYPYPQGGNPNNINRADFSDNYHYKAKQNPYLQNNPEQSKNTQFKKMDESHNKQFQKKNSRSNIDNNVIQKDPIYYDNYTYTQEPKSYEYYEKYINKDQNKNEIKGNYENQINKRTTTQIENKNNIKNEFQLEPAEKGQKSTLL